MTESIERIAWQTFPFKVWAFFFFSLSRSRRLALLNLERYEIHEGRRDTSISDNRFNFVRFGFWKKLLLLWNTQKNFG